MNVRKTAAWRCNMKACLTGLHVSQSEELLYISFENSGYDFLKRSFWQRGCGRIRSVALGVCSGARVKGWP